MSVRYNSTTLCRFQHKISYISNFYIIYCSWSVLCLDLQSFPYFNSIYFWQRYPPVLRSDSLRSFHAPLSQRVPKFSAPPTLFGSLMFQFWKQTGVPSVHVHDPSNAPWWNPIQVSATVFRRVRKSLVALLEFFNFYINITFKYLYIDAIMHSARSHF